MPAIQAYTLPPDKYAQAVAFANARHILHFASFAISAAVLLALIFWRVGPRWRKLHPALFIAALVLLTGLFDLPAEAYGHSVSLKFGISIQAWPSWFWDWTKEQLVSVVVSVAALWPFYMLLRRSPTRWWLWAWLAFLPLEVLLTYAEPLIIEPLFNTYQPLDKKHPELVKPIEQMLGRAGVTISRDHLFEMDASEKTNALNAYVSGFGGSKRLVLWDTIIRKENGPPLFTTIGHELGHYVLHHIEIGLVLGALAMLAALILLYYGLNWIVRRWGESLDIRGPADLASIPVLFLLGLTGSFVSEPLFNAISRSQEHAADLYSIEVTHGVIPNPGEAAAQAFQVEGETDLDLPDPSPFVVFWFYSHPPTADRLRFSLEYDPWSKGQRPKYVQGD
jgi:Zn-dependent protease with chaperone function